MKEIAGLLIPGYKICEYLLVLAPHEELRNKITEVKKAFFEKYQAGKFFGGKPHIVLVNYLQYEIMEGRIVNHLQAIAMGYTCNGYSSVCTWISLSQIFYFYQNPIIIKCRYLPKR